MIIHQPDSVRVADTEIFQPRELKQLAETYAIRARELSDAVAALGLHVAAGKRFDRDITEIQRLRLLAEEAHQDLLGVLDSPKATAAAA